MHRIQPLPNTHPEFSFIDYPSCREYRVENWKIAKDGSGRKGLGRLWFLFLVAVVSLVSWLVRSTVRGPILYLSVGAVLAFLIRSVFWVIIYESVIIFPPHGIQFETHRGFRSWTLATSRSFIPSAILDDVIINEALRGWNVRYYIAAVTQPKQNVQVLHVAFPNLLPHFPVLQVVFSGIQSILPCNRNA